MGTKRTRIARVQQRGVSEAVRRFLQSGEYPAVPSFELFMLERGNRARLRAVWLEARDELLAEWIRDRPGTRPWAWWQFSAPRWPRRDWPAHIQRCGGWCDDLWAEPRKRLGGTGTPEHEEQPVLPQFDRGIPVDFVSRTEVDFYRTIARAAPGRPVKALDRYARAFHGKALNPRNPPQYEAEAAYLDRHNLLLDSERKRLPVSAFDPIRIAVDAETP